MNQTTAYQYDPVGNRTQMTDRKGQVHTYTYDQANRLTQTSAGGQTISYTYDPNGNRLTLTDPTGTTQFQYDPLDRLTRTNSPDGKTVQATYDKSGNHTGLTNPVPQHRRARGMCATCVGPCSARCLEPNLRHCTGVSGSQE